jgi:DNA topoisomerase-1
MVRGLLYAGRVQLVAVRLVVDRERDIDVFDPVEYWTIGAELSQQKYRNEKPRSYFQAKLHKLKGEDPVLSSEAQVQPHVEKLNKAEWTVSAVRLSKRNRRPAAPFTTSTLQQEASRKINFGANKTMRIAQQLYEGVDIGLEGSVGLITYMRTDSVTVSKEAQNEARGYIIDTFDADHVPEKPPVYKTRSKTAQEAHEAVRPTSVLRIPARVKKHLSKDQFRLYELIWLRFVASQMAPAIYDTVSVDIMAGDKTVAPEDRPYLFRAAGSTLRFAGFLALYEETEPDDKPDDDDNKVPTDLNQDEIVDLMKLLPEQHFTQPPPRFSEATLVKELEENGIGRPSTYASIISTIQTRGYVEVEDKRLVPTEIGEVVTDLLVEHFPDVMSVDFTARLEDDLDDIAEGKPWLPVMDSFYGAFANRLEKADEAIEKVDVASREPELVGRDCPESGHPLVYRESRYGRFIGCSDFPNCRYTEQIITKIGIDCPKDGGDLIEKRTRKGGRLFYGCSNYPECDWVSWKRPLEIPCPICGGMLVQANRRMAECTKCGERQPMVQIEGEKETA